MPIGAKPYGERREARHQLFGVVAEIVGRLGIFDHALESTTNLLLIGLGFAGCGGLSRCDPELLFRLFDQAKDQASPPGCFKHISSTRSRAPMPESIMRPWQLHVCRPRISLAKSMSPFFQAGPQLAFARWAYKKTPHNVPYGKFTPLRSTANDFGQPEIWPAPFRSATGGACRWYASHSLATADRPTGGRDRSAGARRVAELVALQAEYQAWLDALPESATAEALRAICDLDLSELESIEPPRGIVRYRRMNRATDIYIKALSKLTLMREDGPDDRRRRGRGAGAAAPGAECDVHWLEASGRKQTGRKEKQI